MQKIRTILKTTKKSIEEDLAVEGEKKSKNMKPDKIGHHAFYEGCKAKKTTLPGQMYVPQKTSNESEFVGEKKNS